MKYLIMHGSYGSPDENWFRWLESEIAKLGHEVILEQFPVDDWDEVSNIGQTNIDNYLPKESLTTWSSYFSTHILPKIEGQEIGFVGHSIAPVFMLHMLTKHDLRIKLGIFVAPFFNIPDDPSIWQFYPVNKTFYSEEFDFAAIKKKIGASHIIYGDDDPYVPTAEPLLFAKKLDGKVHVIPNGRHCGSNFNEFPLLLNLIKEEDKN